MRALLTAFGISSLTFVNAGVAGRSFGFWERGEEPSVFASAFVCAVHVGKHSRT